MFRIAATTVALSLLGSLRSIAKRGLALDQRHDVGVVRTAEKVTFPVTWHGAVIGIGRPLADGDAVSTICPSPLFVVPPLAWRICRAVRRCTVCSFISARLASE